jgi:integrase
MKLAASGVRGVFWKAHDRGTQILRADEGRQRGDWWIRWECLHGHLHRKRVGPKSLAQTDSEKHRIERPCPARRPKPVPQLLTDVIAEYLEHNQSKRSWKDDARHGKRWNERFRGRTLEEITTGDLQRIRTERVAKVKPATVNREFALLRRVFNVAIRDGKTERNPVAKLGMLKEPSGRVRYLTDDEEKVLMKALATDADRQRVTVLLQTGLRKSEFLGLRWKDIDLKAGVLTIPRSKNGETRHVPLTSTVRAIIGNLPRALNRSALVFPNGEGKRDLRWPEKIFPKAVADAAIDDFRFHDLRHTFASRLAMENVDLLTIRDLGGWKTLSMVQRYSHLSPSHRQTAIERLATRKVEADEPRVAGSE